MGNLRLSVKGMAAVLVLAGCAGTPGPAGDAAAAPAKPVAWVVLAGANTCGVPGFRDAFIRQLRAARAAAHQCGNVSMQPAPPLAWSDALFSAAARHSADMARRDYFDHASPEGVRVGQRVTAEGYTWRGVGENIAGGDKSIDRVMAGWMRSPGHCKNIMQPEFTEVAVACVERPDSQWGTYWTMVLGRR
ncbi:MAG: CAP domain-containing protein [Pseudomonadota bacterium]